MGSIELKENDEACNSDFKHSGRGDRLLRL